MPAFHLNASDLELALSSWPDSRFPSLCNALIWAYADRSHAEVAVSFTEREKARDCGVDASVEVESRNLILGPFLSPGWNVFQFKRRDVIAERRTVIAGLKRSLEGAVADVAVKCSRVPGSYTLFTNVHLNRSQSEAIHKAIAKGFSGNIRVSINGAAEIAAMLNDLPHIRYAYFGIPRFQTWQDGWNTLSQVKLAGAHVELVGRDSELEKVKKLLDERDVRAIIVYGQHDVGKDRLVLEATKSRKDEVLVTPDPHALSARDFQELGSGSRDVLLVAQDVDQEELARLLPFCLAQTRVKLICSVPTLPTAILPNYGLDERIQSLRLEPLNDSDARTLLKKTGAQFDYSLLAWTLAHAGGIPGVLLLAASLGRELRDRTDDFFQSVGEAFRARVERELGHEALLAARVFSLLTRVADSELAALAKTLGAEPSAVREQVRNLEAAGLLLKRGPFHEVNPPLLAQFLAAQAIAGERLKLYQFLVTLDGPARIRFFRRLAELPSSPELDAFWNEVLGPAGLFPDLDSLSARGYLLPMLAEASPERTLECLQRLLEPLPVERRKAMPDGSRRHLVGTLENLLLRGTTSAGAAWLLLLLAEAEDEDWANNAAGLFYEFFMPLHPQIAAGFADRIEVLRRALFESTRERQLLAVQAAERALGYQGSVTLRRASGFTLPDSDSRTYGEAYDYAAQLLELLCQAGSASDEGVAASARKSIPRAANVVFRLRPHSAVAALQQALDWLRQEKGGIDPADFVDCLSLLLENQEHFPEKAKAHIAEIRQIRAEVEQLGFPQQVRLWTGAWRLGDLPEAEAHVRELVRQTVKEPGILSDALLQWLLNSDRGYLFLLLLGEEDLSRSFLPRLEACAKEGNAGGEKGVRAFGSYCAAWGRVDAAGFREYLREIQQRDISPQAMVNAAHVLPGDPVAVRLLVNLLKERRADPIRVAEMLTVFWLQDLLPADFLSLARVIAGASFENSPSGIHLLAAWAGFARPFDDVDLRNFAWLCLEAGYSYSSRVRSQDHAWHADELAATLTAKDPDRGFSLLQKLLVESGQHFWDPLVAFERRRFWRTLTSIDRQRALQSVFSSPYSFLAFHGDTILEPEADAEFLVQLASTNHETAARVILAVGFDQPGFWKVVLPIIARFPESGKVGSALEMAVLSYSFVGSAEEAREARRRNVKGVLEDPATPPAAKPWLRTLERALSREAGSESIWEYDLDARDLKRFIDDRNAPERLWAISRILKHAKWEDVQELLTPEDIKDALPLIDMPEREKRALEMAVEHWLRRA